jgi:hypothetical protein
MKLKAAELAQKGEFHEIDNELNLMLEQLALNKIEAESPSLFKSGWRPMIGWICAGGFFYATIMYPLLTWVASVWDVVPPPNLETGILMSTMLGMLGLGGMRSFEKFKQITK